MQLAWAIVSIIFIDLVLSGDNAVVIGMAAHRLPAQQRRMAIIFGGGAAIVLRIVLTVAAALLLELSGLRLIGGFLLIWIGFKLLKEEEATEGTKVASTMKDAIVTILIADFIMSLDNVVGVATASQGNLWLLAFGLAFSMGILMLMGSLLANLIDKFTWLAYAGSAIIVWTGVKSMFDDPLVLKRLAAGDGLKYASAAVITAATVAFAHWFHRIRN